MASGPGTGIAAPPEEHVAKMTAADPALRAAVTRALATNDQASLLAMQPGLNAVAGQMAQMAITPQGNVVSIPSAIAAAAPLLQQLAQQTTATLPTAQAAALQQLATQQVQQPLVQNQAEVGRALVRRTTAAVDPQLEAIRSDLEHRGNQIQATSEHRNIEARKAFQRQVLYRLGAIERAARIQRY